MDPVLSDGLNLLSSLSPELWNNEKKTRKPIAVKARKALSPKISNQTQKLKRESMASSRKPVPENKGNGTQRKASKGNSGNKRRNDKNSKTCNGTVSNSKIVPVQSSSSESQHEVEDGAEITKTPTSSSKSRKGKQKVEREREEEVAEKEDAKMNKFPMDRIKRIIRSEDSNLRISSEAIFLVNIATEKFLEKFCADSYACCVQDRKKSLGYKHLSSVVCKRRKYDFLSDFVPEKLKAEDALAEAKLTKSEAG